MRLDINFVNLEKIQKSLESNKSILFFNGLAFSILIYNFIYKETMAVIAVVGAAIIAVGIANSVATVCCVRKEMRGQRKEIRGLIETLRAQPQTQTNSGDASKDIEVGTVVSHPGCGGGTITGGNITQPLVIEVQKNNIRKNINMDLTGILSKKNNTITKNIDE